MKEAFQHRRFNIASRVMINAANEILEEMHDKGYTDSLTTTEHKPKKKPGAVV